MMHWRFDAFGGGESYLAAITRRLAAAGHELIVMTGASFGAAQFDGNFRHLTLPESSGLRSGLREKAAVLEAVDAVAPDVVHFHHLGGFLSPLVEAALHQRYPCLRTLHDVSIVCPLENEMIKQCGGAPCFHRFDGGCVTRGCYPLAWGPRPFLSRFWQRRIGRLTDRLLVSTRYMQCELLRNDFEASRITVLPLFTDMAEDQEVEHDVAAQRRLLFVGRLDRSKGGMDFIEALGRLTRAGRWSADVIGDGPMEAEIRARAEAMGLTERVCFLGRVAAGEMAGHYARARLLVMPSRIPESFGLAGIEAMACGRPVVAYDSGGIGDWLVDGETGYLVGHADVAALARRVGELLEDDRLVSAMGAAGRQRVQRCYRAPAHVDALLSQYQAVRAARRRDDHGGVDK